MPIIFGAVAGWDLLQGQDGFVRTLTATLALLAGLFPAIYAALKLDEHLPKAAGLAGEYKNLEILFSDLGKVGPTKVFADFEASAYLVEFALFASTLANFDVSYPQCYPQGRCPGGAARATSQ